MGAYIQQAEIRTQQAEVRAQQAETRALKADFHVEQAEARIRQAETRAQQSEARAQQAEIHAQQSESRAQQAEEHAREAESQAQQAEARAQQSEARAQQAEIHFQDAENRVQSVETLLQQVRIESNAWRQQVDVWHDRVLAIHNSTSWKVTKPLRGVRRLLRGDGSPIRKIQAGIVLKLKQTFRPLAISAIHYVFKRPELRRKLSHTIKNFPWLYQRLLHLARNSGIISANASSNYVEKYEDVTMVYGDHELSPRTQKIFFDLKVAIEKNNKGGANENSG